MRLVLTHENADFDAVAALLAAHLLDERYLPVLPHRVNRNVRAYLTLYGDGLPFRTRQDVPREPVEAVMLVDTQTLPDWREMDRHRVPVQVVDHHQAKGRLQPHWQVHIEPVGATTTLLVERLAVRSPALTDVQATLLLLGIYEDTGSLSYPDTTARDVRAAAYLLEHGADLGRMADFLNPPLTPQQRMLYDILLANAEIHRVRDATVAIACAEVRGLTEDIASVAHKLRDTMDTDALFVLVTVAGGVQLVARSTHPRVDVGGVARALGGGGHARAAAALLKESTLSQARQRLLEVLPRHVRPALTVGQIMSRRPQVLHPDTPAEEAARLMQTFGYEGYPVVEDGRVIGLLTRRAVDRALSHGLNLPARRLMEAGTVTVRPEDTVETLQQLMTDTGWGQIPVVDEQGRVIGIVTRTDLIKTLAPRPRLPGRLNLAARLESVLPPARLALLRAVAHQAEQLHFALYIVGGFVRDLLLEHPSPDLDLVVEGNAIALGRALQKRFGGRLTVHRRFGTAKWHLEAVRQELAAALEPFLPPGISTAPDPEDLPPTLDLVTARTEFYAHPTSLPTVARSSIKLDLHRRDFTINTLAIRLDGRHYGELHDYWGGLADLRRGVIRVLHSLSFVDDPTRMLRAVRFEQRFGFTIEPRTLQLLREARDLLARVSGDRIRHEFHAIWREERAEAMLDRLRQLALLNAVHPALFWDEAAAQRTPLRRTPPESFWGDLPLPRTEDLPTVLAYALWWMPLSPEQARAAARRLLFSKRLTEIVVGAAVLWGQREHLRTASPSAFTFACEAHPLTAVYALYLVADRSLREHLQRFVRTWRHVRPLLSGHDLRARGLPPGPRYKRLLRALRAARLDGLVHTRADEEAYLERLLAGRHETPDDAPAI